MRRLAWLLPLFLVISFPIACTPSKIIVPSTIVNCTWPAEPVPTYTADKATVAQIINDLLEDKNNFVDYILKTRSVKQCYDASLAK